MKKDWLRGEIATALLLFSLLAMGLGSLIGVREIQKGSVNTVLSRAQTSSCKYKSEMKIVDNEGNVVTHPDLKIHWAHYRPNGENFDMSTAVREGDAKVPTGRTNLGLNGTDLDAKSKDALAEITLPESPLYTIVGWRCTNNNSVNGCQGEENMDGDNKVGIVMHCGGDNSYEFIVEPQFNREETASPTPESCTYESKATIKDQNGVINVSGKTAGFSVGYKFTTKDGKEYAGNSYFTNGAIQSSEKQLRQDVVGQPVELTLNYNQDMYEIVSANCSDDNANKSCSNWANEKVILNYTCGAKNNYGWVVKPKPMTAQFGLFTPDGGHKCAVSANNVDFKQEVHHNIHGNIKCTEIYHRDTDMFEVSFKIKTDEGANLGDSPILFRTSRCEGVSSSCEEPILRQLRVKELKRGNSLKCVWKKPFNPGSDTPECTGVTIPPRPQLTGTIDSIIMEKGDATYVYSRSVDGCSRTYTGGGSSCTKSGLKCSTISNGMEIKIENRASVGHFQVGEYKGCPCNEDGICDDSHKYLPGTRTVADSYKNRALYDKCLGDNKSKIKCTIDGPSPCEQSGNGYGTCTGQTIGTGGGDKNAQLDINRSYWIKRNYGKCSTAGNDNGTCPAGYKCSADGSTITIQKVCGQSSQRIYVERFYDCACNPSGQCREDLGGRYSKLIDETLENGVSCNVDTGVCTRIGSTCGGTQPGISATPKPPTNQTCSGAGASCKDDYVEACGKNGTRICHKVGKCSAAGGGDKCSWGTGSCCDICSDGSRDGATCRTGGPANPTTPPQRPVQPTPTTAPSCSSGTPFNQCVCTCQKGGDTIGVCVQECTPQTPQCDCVDDGAGYKQCNTGCAQYGTTGNQCSTKQSCMRPEPTSTPPQGRCPVGQCRYTYGDTDECTAMTSTYTYCGERVDCPLGQGVTRSIYGINSDGTCKIEQTSCQNSNYCGNNTPPTSSCPSGQCRFVWGDINECRPTTTNQTFCGERANCSVGQGVTVSIYGTKSDGTCGLEYTNCRDSNYCGNNYNTPIPTLPSSSECSCLPTEYGLANGGCNQGCVPESWLGGNRNSYCTSDNRCTRSNSGTSTYQKPSNLTPNNNADLKVKPNSQGKYPVDFSWSAISGASGYRIHGSSSCGIFSSFPASFDQQVKDTSFNTNFPGCGLNTWPRHISWTVQAIFPDGSKGPEAPYPYFNLRTQESQQSACGIDTGKCLNRDGKCIDLVEGDVQCCSDKPGYGRPYQVRLNNDGTCNIPDNSNLACDIINEQKCGNVPNTAPAWCSGANECLSADGKGCVPIENGQQNICLPSSANQCKMAQYRVRLNRGSNGKCVTGAFVSCVDRNAACYALYDGTGRRIGGSNLAGQSAPASADIDNNGKVTVQDALLAIQEIRTKGTLHGKKVTSFAQAISEILGSLGQSIKN